MSPFEKYAGTAGHTVLTLACASIRPELGFLVAALFAGRELAQAEYRYIKAHGGKRANCPWWCGFAPSAWDIKSLLDWLLPLATAILTA